MVYSYAYDERASLSRVTASRQRWRLCRLSGVVMRSMMEAIETNWRGRSVLRQAFGPPTKLLSCWLTPCKQSTSHFLIDNFGACLTRRPVPARCGEWRVNGCLAPGFTQTSHLKARTCSSNRQRPELETGLSHRKQRTENFLIANFRPILHLPIPARTLVLHLPTPKLRHLTSSSNRHIPELESGLSHRKQRIGPLSNRHKFTFFNSVVSLSLPPCFPASLPSLAMGHESRVTVFFGDLSRTERRPVAARPSRCDNCP
jgi:hypothetical protein